MYGDRIEGYYKCQCGALTVSIDGKEYSVGADQREQFLPGLDLRKLHRFHKDTYACNHCVNHSGLDLCACGSGEPYQKCQNGFAECGTPAQVLGEYGGY